MPLQFLFLPQLFGQVNWQLQLLPAELMSKQSHRHRPKLLISCKMASLAIKRRLFAALKFCSILSKLFSTFWCHNAHSNWILLHVPHMPNSRAYCGGKYSGRKSRERGEGSGEEALSDILALKRLLFVPASAAGNLFIFNLLNLCHF